MRTVCTHSWHYTFSLWQTEMPPAVSKLASCQLSNCSMALRIYVERFIGTGKCCLGTLCREGSKMYLVISVTFLIFAKHVLNWTMFMWPKGYIHNLSFYHHQMSSIAFVIFFCGCVSGWMYPHILSVVLYEHSRKFGLFFYQCCAVYDVDKYWSTIRSECRILLYAHYHRYAEFFEGNGHTKCLS